MKIALILLLIPLCLQARQRTFGWCEQGGQTVTVGGQTSSPSTPIQRSYPNCTVTVYFTGTTTLATLYSNDNGTPLSNPFTANSNGYWFFYADASRYDVRFSGSNIPTPITEGDIAVGQIGGRPYTVNALNPPQQILNLTHGLGPNVTVDCWSGPLLFPIPPGNYGQVSGDKVLCQVANDGRGNLIVNWYDGVVGSIMVSASGYGPYGPSGPAGYGAIPYVANATSSPMLIPFTLHHQGPNVSVDCWDGVLISGNITGVKVFCQASMSVIGNGDVTLTWGNGTVRSFMISASGRAQPYVTNVTLSPQTILSSIHKQGFTPDVSCWDGIVSGSATQGNKVYCAVIKNPSGDVTVTWGGSTVQSIQIQ